MKHAEGGGVMANIKYLPLGGIVTEGMQIRVKMDPDVVLDYAEAMKAGKKFPPLLTFFDGENYFLADGFHRLYAARELKLAKIACEVREGTRFDARLAACGANKEHGLRLRNPDKRQAVKVVLEIRSDWSNRLVAEHVGVTHPLVSEMRQLVTVTSSNLRNPRQSTGFGPPPSRPVRMGMDGKFRKVPPVPVRPNVPEVGDQRLDVSEDSTVTSEQSVVSSGENESDGQTVGQSGGDAVGGETEVGLVDSLGRHVPEDLAPLWHRRQEVQDFLTALSRMRSTIRHAQEGHDPLWAETNFSAALMHLDRAYSEIDATKPYVVCPMCQGIGCRACKERGLLGKFRYDTVIPRELKIAPPGRRE